MNLTNKEFGWLLSEGLHELANAERRSRKLGKPPLVMGHNGITPDDLELLSTLVLDETAKSSSPISALLNDITAGEGNGRATG